jgi:hypothetical protein
MATIAPKILFPCKRYAHLSTKSERLGQAAAEFESSAAWAQKTAGAVPVGVKTLEAQLDALGSDLALNSTATSLDEAGQGIGAIVRRGNLNDDFIAAAVQNGSRMCALSNLDPANYTPVELFRDWKIIHRDNPNIPLGDVLERMKNQAATDASAAGVVTEVRGAAYVNSLGPGNLVEIGCDSIPGSPLYRKQVDLRSTDTLFQAKLTPELIITAIADEPLSTAQAIKDALAAMRPGHEYKFMQFTDPYWKPTAAHLNDLNEALRAHGVAQLTLGDFIYVPLR